MICLGFLVLDGLSLPQIDITIFLTFMEYLHTNQNTVLTINNYISAVSSSFIRYGLTLASFENHRIYM